MTQDNNLSLDDEITLLNLATIPVLRHEWNKRLNKFKEA
jgi:hypothetical protein